MSHFKDKAFPSPLLKTCKYGIVTNQNKRRKIVTINKEKKSEEEESPTHQGENVLEATEKLHNGIKVTYYVFLPREVWGFCIWNKIAAKKKDK